MTAPGQPRPRTFLEILLAPKAKMMLAICVVFACVYLSTAWWMVAVTPQNYSGTTSEVDVAIDVPFSAEQPVLIRMSHDFRLVRMTGAINLGRFYVDGPDPVNYTINITDSEGKLVRTITGGLSAPESYHIDLTKPDTVVTIQREERLTLEPGAYTFTFDAGHVMNYRVEQKSMFLWPSVGLGGLGVVFLLAVIAQLNAAYRKWEQENGKAEVMVRPPSPQPPAVLYRPFPAIPERGAGPPASHAAGPDPDSDIVGYMCGKCGNVIQNPVVQNVITCENCGEREYVG
jgi:hypothetical protein